MIVCVYVGSGDDLKPRDLIFVKKCCNRDLSKFLGHLIKDLEGKTGGYSCLPLH